MPLLVLGGQVSALVVGGGEVAARKVGGLVDAKIAVRVVAPRIGAALRALAAAQPALVTVAERPYESGDVGDAELVFAATDDRVTNAAVAREARALHRLVSVADGPEDGSFTGMAVHRADELLVAVSAGGVPGAAARVRDAIAERFGPAFGEAVTAASALRRTLLAAGARERWRAASAALFGAAFCAEVERGSFAARVAEWR